MTFATYKHNLDKVREQGRLDGLLGINNADFLPCRCRDCRSNYLDGQADALFMRSKNEHGKNGA